MTTLRGSSSPRRANAGLAGHEAMGATPGSQQFPSQDTPASHLRNALAITQLLELEPDRGTLGRALVEVTKLVALALEGLERTPVKALEQVRDLEEMERTNRELRCPCGEMAVTDCAGECGRDSTGVAR